jgi:hypothetical protein
MPGGYGGRGGYAPYGGYGAAAPAQPRGTPPPQRGIVNGRPGMAMGGMAPGAMPEGRVEDPAARDADARATQALGKTISVNFDGVALGEALEFIADQAGLDVVADWKSLEPAGIDRNAQVTLNLRRGAPAEQVLNWVLRSGGGDNAAFAIDHGVVLVSTPDRIDRMVITRAYPLGNLADAGPQVENLVRDTVAPQSWRENGGAGSVRFFSNKLIVTATEPNHRQVERLLGLMEAQGAGAAPPPAASGYVPAPRPSPAGAQ